MSIWFIIIGLLVVILGLALLYFKTAPAKKRTDTEADEEYIYPLW